MIVIVDANLEPFLPSLLRQIREARTVDAAVQVGMRASDARNHGHLTKEELRVVRDAIHSFRLAFGVEQDAGVTFRIQG